VRARQGSTAGDEPCSLEMVSKRRLQGQEHTGDEPEKKKQKSQTRQWIVRSKEDERETQSGNHDSGGISAHSGAARAEQQSGSVFLRRCGAAHLGGRHEWQRCDLPLRCGGQSAFDHPFELAREQWPCDSRIRAHDRWRRDNRRHSRSGIQHHAGFRHGEEGCQVPFPGKKLSSSIRSWEESGGWMLAVWFTTP